MASDSEATNRTTDQISDMNDPKSLVKGFYKLQEERIQTYKLFDEGFQAYLKGAPNYNFPMYRQLVHEITTCFSRISEDIRKISEKLSEKHKLVSVSKCIKNIQNEESKKLEFTAALQLATQSVIDEPSEVNHQEECNRLKKSLQETSQNIIDQMEELKYEAEDVLLAVDR